MGFLDDFAIREYRDEADPVVAAAFLERDGQHQLGEVAEFVVDHVNDQMLVRCTCGGHIAVSRHMWMDAVVEECRAIARKRGGPLVGPLAMADAARHVSDHPSGLSPEALQADALKAVEDRDVERAERRIAELFGRKDPPS